LLVRRDRKLARLRIADAFLNAELLVPVDGLNGGFLQQEDGSSG
jgi:hypothetical protein